MSSDSYHHCVNGTPCPTGNECTAMQSCVNHVCVMKNCLNTANFCPMGQHCDQASATCLPDMAGNCMMDTDCMSGYYCNTAVTPQPVCQAGCRGSSDCMGGVCNAMHQCQGAMGGLCGTCMSSNDCPAGTMCLPIVNKCYQACSMASGMTCPMEHPTCNMFGFCSCFM
jgi:hypothetical protein